MQTVPWVHDVEFYIEKMWIQLPVVDFTRFNVVSTSFACWGVSLRDNENKHKYSRLSLSRNRRDHHKHFEISVLRHIKFVILRKKQFVQPNFTNDYVICLL